MSLPIMNKSLLVALALAVVGCAETSDVPEIGGSRAPTDPSFEGKSEDKKEDDITADSSEDDDDDADEKPEAKKEETKPAQPKPKEPTQPAKPATCTGAQEKEGNNTAATANVLALQGVMCGRIDSANDVDFFTITASKVKLQFGVELDASLRISSATSSQQVNGASTVSFGNGTKQTYTVEVRSKDGKPQIYGLKIEAQ